MLIASPEFVQHVFDLGRRYQGLQHLPVWGGYCALLFQNRVLSVIDKQCDIEIDPPFEAEG